MSTLLIRADASSGIGAGHVMRCLALAEHWRERGGAVAFFSDCTAPALLKRIQAAGAEICPVFASRADEAISAVIHAGKTDPGPFLPWVVFDGYQLNSAAQQRVKEAGLPLMCMDDMAHVDHYWADIVVNQTHQASESAYPSREAHTQLLLGARYAILRKEFRAAAICSKNISGNIRNLLITFGGADPDNLTARALEACKGFPGLAIRVIVGGANPHVESLRELIRRSGLSAEQLVAVDNMPEQMQWADAAITAAGQTCWELALLGVPALVAAIADNQRPNAEVLDKEGIAIRLGSGTDLTTENIKSGLSLIMDDPSRREQMSARGRALIDGHGVERVVECMRMKQFRFRPVQEADSRWIWELSNDPSVRQTSFRDQPIPWESHVEWFHRRIHDDRNRFWIVETDKGIPMGQLRMDEGNPNTSISMSLGKEYRGFGWGKAIIRKTCERHRQAGGGRILAEIRAENTASVRAFESAGFRPKGGGEVHGKKAVFLEWDGNP